MAKDDGNNMAEHVDDKGKVRDTDLNERNKKAIMETFKRQEAKFEELYRMNRDLTYAVKTLQKEVTLLKQGVIQANVANRGNGATSQN